MAAFVRRAADLFGAEVTLLHVCDLMSHDGFELYIRSPQEVAETHRSVAGYQLDSFLECEFPGTGCHRLLRSGDATAEIVEAAKNGQFDLIVMPTHAGTFRRMLLGSTTAKVLDQADCPVLTTQHAETAILRPLDHRMWLCALSLGSDSERVLCVASRAAAQAQAKLTVVHVIDSDASIELVGQEARRLNELLKKVGCQAAIDVPVGPTKEAILKAAQRCAADVIFIGRPLSSGVLGRIRDLTYEVVRDAPCPVLSV